MSRVTIIGARASLRSRARGAVLFIALIVLVAMSLAGIAIMRSVDTATLIAGNLAFKQGTVQSSDNGIEQAYLWLLANRVSLWTNNPGQGYQSGYATPVWTSGATWAGAVNLGADLAGNTSSYQIHRMCNCADTTYNGVSATCPQGNQCALDNPSGTGAPPPPAAGDSFVVEPGRGYLQDPKVYYRITVRTQGPRSTVSYIQAMVAVAL